MARRKHAKKVSCNTNCRRLRKIAKRCVRKHHKPGTKGFGACVRSEFRKLAPKARRTRRHARRARRSRR